MKIMANNRRKYRSVMKYGESMAQAKENGVNRQRSWQRSGGGWRLSYQHRNSNIAPWQKYQWRKWRKKYNENEMNEKRKSK